MHAKHQEKLPLSIQHRLRTVRTMYKTLELVQACIQLCTCICQNLPHFMAEEAREVPPAARQPD